MIGISVRQAGWYIWDMARPMYRQIADDLRSQIQSERLAPGARLPTELELREHYGASRTTISSAIRWLTIQGLVTTVPGVGSFVAQRIDPFVTILSTDPRTGFGGGEGTAYLSEVSGHQRVGPSSMPKVEVQVAPAEIALRLRIASGAQVVSRHQERFIDGAPWSLQTSFYPMNFVTGGNAPRLMMAHEIPEGTVCYLEQAMGIKQTGYQDWFTARTPDMSEVDFFYLPPDGHVAVYEIFRTAFDQNGKPFRVTVTVFPIDRNQFIVNAGDVPAHWFGADDDLYEPT
jgi:GntR family transcriptional regulator